MTKFYQIDVTGLEALISRLDSSTREDVIIRSMNLGGALLAGWSKKNRLSGPRPNILGVKTGRLRSSISSSQTAKSGNSYETRVGTNVAYARIHEYGGYTGRNRSTFIPARPFLAPSIQDRANQQQIIDILTRNINEALSK